MDYCRLLECVLCNTTGSSFENVQFFSSNYFRRFNTRCIRIMYMYSASIA